MGKTEIQDVEHRWERQIAFVDTIARACTHTRRTTGRSFRVNGPWFYQFYPFRLPLLLVTSIFSFLLVYFVFSPNFFRGTHRSFILKSCISSKSPEVGRFPPNPSLGGSLLQSHRWFPGPWGGNVPFMREAACATRTNVGALQAESRTRSPQQVGLALFGGGGGRGTWTSFAVTSASDLNP